MVPAAVMVLEALPLAPHGKLDRNALPELEFISDEGYRAPRTPEEEVLCQLFAEILGLDRVGLDDNFFKLGGDSIRSIQLVGRARKAGLGITIRDLYQQPSVDALISVIRVAQQKRISGQDMATGALQITPIMSWLHGLDGQISHFSQSILLEVPPKLGQDRLIGAVQKILDHHDSLRLRLKSGPGSSSWSLEIAQAGVVRAEWCTQRVSVVGLSRNWRQECINEHRRSAKRRLDPETGLMVQVVWFDAGSDEAGQLLLVIHHMAVDGVSWRILLPDLKAAWEAITVGRSPDLGPKSTSYRRWAELLSAHAHDPKRVEELAFWRHTLSEAPPFTLEAQLDAQRARAGVSHYLTRILPASITEALLNVPAALDCGMNDVLLTGLAVALAVWRKQCWGWAGSNAVLLDMERHGREEIFESVDLSRTVGWFTSLFPVRLDIGSANLEQAWMGQQALGDALKAIKEQLAQVPDGGIGFGLLRYLNAETAEELARFDAPQIRFNYLGSFLAPKGAYWRLSFEGGSEGAIDADISRPYCLEVNALTVHGTEGAQLSANWIWAPAVLSERTVQELADGWFHALKMLVLYTAQADEHFRQKFGAA
jgi:non-ribosomal peptide synthase protein (TIGR01720 family)